MTLATRIARIATDPAYRTHRRLCRAYDALFSGVVSGNVVVSAPEFGGSFEVDCKSDILKRLLVDGHYETDLVETVRRRVDPSRDAIDVGANIGLFTLLLARLVAPNRVLAVEPTPGALRRLRANLERNGGHNVEVFPGAAAEKAGEIVMNVIAGMEEYSTSVRMVHPSTAGKRAEQVTAPAETLDRLVEQHGLRPGFIKIDAEGAEQSVVLGCEQTMKVHRPVILCEVWPDDLLSAAGGHPGAMASLLASRGYDYREIGQGEILAFPSDRAQGLK